ncbi:flavodoxin family protein [Ornithinimicrobium cavernae]|uniref:flavodoxin family protein n=1 Tax=Ornithinimicrobium cavernae TaxID=2666047 RepID=UPI000D69A780|nr:flavodoxin family protein [Ornithinimicrobium cavernae]
MTDSTAPRRLLVVHHTPSPGMQAMLEAALAGARDEEIEGVEVVVRPALQAGPVDVLEADGYLLATPANIGYMSGALKHFFDQIYYPCLGATTSRPYAAYVHGNEGTEGAVRAIGSIASALGWEPVAPTLEVMGTPDREALASCRELGAVVAATIMPGI